MGSVYPREGSQFLWLKWLESGREHRSSSGTADRAAAKKLLAEIERQVRERVPPAEPGPSAERFFHATWIPLRKQLRPSVWKTDRGRLQHHFLPTFGEKPLAWLGTDAGEVAVIDWLAGLCSHKAKRDGTTLAARTVLNTASIVRVFRPAPPGGPADALPAPLRRRWAPAQLRGQPALARPGPGDAAPRRLTASTAFDSQAKIEKDTTTGRPATSPSTRSCSAPWRGGGSRAGSASSAAHPPLTICSCRGLRRWHGSPRRQATGR